MLEKHMENNLTHIETEQDYNRCIYFEALELYLLVNGIKFRLINHYLPVYQFFEGWIHPFVAKLDNIQLLLLFPAGMLVPLRGAPTWRLHATL